MNTDDLNRSVSDFEALHDINMDGADALVAALQEAAAHIRDLNERIAALEAAQKPTKPALTWNGLYPAAQRLLERASESDWIDVRGEDAVVSDLVRKGLIDSVANARYGGRTIHLTGVGRELMHSRQAALEAARPVDTPKVLYEGEASVLKDGILLPMLGARIAMHGHKRVHIVVTAAEDDES